MYRLKVFTVVENVPKILDKSSRLYFVRRNRMLQCTDNCPRRGISKCKKVGTVSKFVVCEKNLDLIKLGAHGRLG